MVRTTPRNRHSGDRDWGQLRATSRPRAASFGQACQYGKKHFCGVVCEIDL